MESLVLDDSPLHRFLTGKDSCRVEHTNSGKDTAGTEDATPKPDPRPSGRRVFSGAQKRTIQLADPKVQRRTRFYSLFAVSYFAYIQH